MKWPFYLLDQFRDIVQGKPRLEVAEMTHRYLEGLPRATSAPLSQPAARVVKETMNNLADLGEKMGADPSS